MTRDLRETMVEAAAAQYGREHYRGILFLRWLSRAWPVALGVAGIVLLGTLGWWTKPAIHAASSHVSATLPWIGGALVVGMLAWLLVRHLRSPYRRRRFRS